MPLTTDKVRLSLLTHYQGRAEISPVERFAAGWETEVFGFETRVPGQTPARQVVRIFPSEAMLPKVRWEFQVMSHLETLGYPVPRVHDLGESSGLFGGPFIIMDRIDGQTLGDVIRSQEHTQSHGLLAKFIAHWVELHALPWRALKPDATALTPDTYVQSEIAEARRTVDAFGLSEALAPLIQWVERRGQTVRCERLSLLHMDYHTNNVLVTADQALSVIDWGGATIGDYRADLAWTVLLLSMYSSADFGRQVYDLYADRLGCAIADFDYFEGMAQARRLFSILVSLTAGPEAVGMRPGAATHMRAEIGHVRTLYALLAERVGPLPLVEQVIAANS